MLSQGQCHKVTHSRQFVYGGMLYLCTLRCRFVANSFKSLLHKLVHEKVLYAICIVLLCMLRFAVDCSVNV